MTAARGEFDEVYAVTAGKRLSVVWTPWMGDWFVSHSPRNANSNAEGQWDQWVSLAINILQHPATAITRADAHAAVQGLDARNYYDEVDTHLSDDQCEQLFGTKEELS